MKMAIIYYSLSNNTKEAAEFLAKKLEADAFRVDLVKEMPKTFKKQILVGGMQVVFNLTPEIIGVPENIADYDKIIVGTPIWAGKVASPINTLLKNSEIAQKTVAIFTLSGGGDNDKCIKSLKKLLVNLKANVALADKKNSISKENIAKLENFAKSLL